jgi:hypothetical protein
VELTFILVAIAGKGSVVKEGRRLPVPAHQNCSQQNQGAYTKSCTEAYIFHQSQFLHFSFFTGICRKKHKAMTGKDNGSVVSKISEISGNHDDETEIASSRAGGKSDDSDTEDTKCLKRSRICVLVVLAVTAVISGALTYIFTDQSQDEDFELRVRNVESLGFCYFCLYIFA